ncbi:MAG: molybdate ABC transporter substrate-binding protein [Rickettsiales bacterium]|nr:molybdate ABC transporter substrate-binding protein [Rickettsiales bacterium]
MIARAISLIVIVLSLCTANQTLAKMVEQPQISILADPTLTIPLTQIARDYAAQHQVSITTSYAATREQEQRIAKGMEADIFITTLEDSIKDLKNQGLVDVYSQIPIAKNRLVIATLKDNPIELILIRNLALAGALSKQSAHFTFALGDPEFQAVGSYGLEALRNFNLASELEPFFIFLQSPADLHKTVASDNSYGVMFQSEVARNKDLKALDVFPENVHRPIIYQAVVVAGEHMAAAREFMQHLTSPEALTILKSYGFEAP